jgi:predicted amidohydrolase YtcJ
MKLIIFLLLIILTFPACSQNEAIYYPDTKEVHIPKVIINGDSSGNYFSVKIKQQTDGNFKISSIVKANKDKLLLNGKIYTVNEQQPWAEAVYIKNGKIEFVGSNAEAKTIAATDAEIINLKGAMVMPGIQDIHMHPLEAESPFAGTCLLSGEETNAENFIAVLRDCAPYQLASDWVLGSGHSIFTLLESNRLPVEILDQAIPDKPAVIMEETSHSIWVNSKALALAGIDSNTPNPTGGVIVKDSLTGKPTGILFDSAGDLIMDMAWLPTEAIKKLNYKGLLSALKKINSYGITSVAEARTYWKRGFHEAWQQAETEGQLTVRAVLNLWMYPNEDDDLQIKKLTKLYKNNSNSLLKISQVKVYSDGILINTTAAMLKPYLITLGEIPSNNGLNYFTEPRLIKYIKALEPIGFDFHIHAIGDRAVHESLNAIQQGNGKSRHRMTHLEIVNSADYKRFKQLNVTADMQVAGDFTQPSHWSENKELIGNRADNLIPLKSLYEAGARITLSSDWDVSTLNPFVGMQNALTRAPQNLPDLATVIKTYTINPAYALRQENTTGSIEVGKFADIIVLNQNIFNVSTDKIKDTKVLKTYLNGNLVFSR